MTSPAATRTPIRQKQEVLKSYTVFASQGKALPYLALMVNMVWVWGVESLNKTEYTILLLASQTGCCPEQAVKGGRFQSVYMYICVGGRIQ